MDDLFNLFLKKCEQLDNNNDNNRYTIIHKNYCNQIKAWRNKIKFQSKITCIIKHLYTFICRVVEHPTLS